MTERFLRVHMHMDQNPITKRWSPMPPDDEWREIVKSLYAIPSDDPTLLSPIMSDEEWTSEEDVPVEPPAEPVDPEEAHCSWMAQQVSLLISKVNNLTVQQERRWQYLSDHVASHEEHLRGIWN